MIEARLGHKSIVETLDTYGRLFPDGRGETTNALDRISGAIAHMRRGGKQCFRTTPNE